MDFQSEDAWCGPAACSAASRALGRPVGQAKFAALAGTTPDGETDEEGIQRALLGAGFVPEVWCSNHPPAACQWLRLQVMAGRPVLVCINGESHWCCVLGVFGKRFVLFDPGRWDYRVNSGVTILPWDALRRRWRAGGTENRRANQTYFGIAVYDSD